MNWFEGLFRIGGEPGTSRTDEEVDARLEARRVRGVERAERAGRVEPAHEPKENSKMKTKAAKYGAIAAVVLVAWFIGKIGGAEFALPDVVPDVKVEETDNSPALLIERLERETVFVAASSDIVHEVDIENATTFAGWRVPWTESRTTWRVVGLAEARVDLSTADIGRTNTGGYSVRVPAPEVSVVVNVEGTEGYDCDHDPIAEVTGGECANVDDIIDEAAAEMKVTAYESGILDEAEASFTEWLETLGTQFGVSITDVTWMDGAVSASDAPSATSSTTVADDEEWTFLDNS